MNIPAEAVEAAAKGAYSVGKIDAGVDWDHLYPTLREVYVDMARAALEAAAPYMLAQALAKDDEAWDSNRVAIGDNPFRRES